MDKRAVILNPIRMKLAESARADWVVNAEEGTTIQDVMDPMYWSHMSAQLHPYDHVEVRLDTGEWMLELVVLSQGLNWAKVHVLHKHDLVACVDAPPEAQKHMVKWRGPQHKFCVMRLQDNQVLQSGLERQAADAWMANYERTVAA